MTDPDIEDIFEDAQGKGKKDGKVLTPRDLAADSPKRMTWAEARDRALVDRPEAVFNVIRKTYDLAEGGNMDAVKVVLERDFGKVATPVEIDTSGLSTDQKITALGALTGAEAEGGGTA